MRSRKTTTQWNFFFNVVSISVTVVSGLLLVPLYLRYIPADTYGGWLATGNILSWLTLIDPGFSTVLLQQVGAAYGAKDQRAVNALITSGLLLAVIIAIVIGLAGLGVSTHFTDWLKLPPSVDVELLRSTFVVALLSTVATVCCFGFTAVNLGLQASLGIGLVAVVGDLGSICLSLVLLFKGYGLYAIVGGLVCRGVVALLGNVLYLGWRLRAEEIRFRPDISRFGSLVRLSSYAYLGRVGGLLVSQIDLFVVARYLGPGMVMALNLTRRAPQMTQLLVQRPAMAFVPSVAHLMGEGDVAKAGAILTRLMIILSSLLALTLAGFLLLNPSFVALWVGPQFYAGSAVNVLICVGLFLGVMTQSLSELCFALGNIRGNSLAALAQSLVYVPLLLVGAKHFGLLGVVAAPLVATLAVAAWYYPRTFVEMVHLDRQQQQVLLLEILKALAVGLLLAAAFAAFPSRNWPMFVILATLFSAAFVTALASISSAFRAELRQAASGLLRRLTSLASR